VGRVHLFEFHELEWFPATWRDLLTDFLSFYAGAFKPYVPVAPLLADALESTGTQRIVDLCSGAGRPVLSLRPALERRGLSDLEVILTDKFPNLESWRVAAEENLDAVKFVRMPVDAADVPGHLKGFRTLFTSFHHFCPDEAREILADAVTKNEGIGVFEYTERNWLVWTLPTLLIPLVVWLCTPFIRPFRWDRLVWTYLVPVVPLVALWDGFVSNLRTYSVAELWRLLDRLEGSCYTWRVGTVRSLGLSRITYVVGVPGS
jgi:hypothetical protein